MRILLYGINYAPELIGVGKFSGEMGAWLAARGHDVRVITAPPYYPAWRISKGYSAFRWQREDLAGVRVYRCPLWVPHLRSGTARIFHLLSFAVSSAPVALWLGAFWRPDVVFAVAPTMATVPAATVAAALGRRRSWLHIQDFEIDAAFGLGLLETSRGWRWRLLLTAERFFLRRFSRVSTISRRMEERLGAKGVDRQRIVPLPNWIDTEAVRPREGRNRFRDELSIPDTAVVALYAGNMGEKQGVETLLEAAVWLRQGDATERSVIVVLCGDGAVKADIERIARNLDNVRMLGLQPANRLGELLNLADIHLLPQRAGAADLVMPSKLIAIMASGKPVVAAAASGTQIAAEVAGAGIVVAPEDGAALAAALSRLARSPDERRRLGQTARERAVAQWDRDLVLARLEARLADLSV